MPTGFIIVYYCRCWCSLLSCLQCTNVLGICFSYSFDRFLETLHPQLPPAVDMWSIHWIDGGIRECGKLIQHDWLAECAWMFAGLGEPINATTAAVACLLFYTYFFFVDCYFGFATSSFPIILLFWSVSAVQYGSGRREGDLFFYFTGCTIKY